MILEDFFSSISGQVVESRFQLFKDIRSELYFLIDI